MSAENKARQAASLTRQQTNFQIEYPPGRNTDSIASGLRTELGTETPGLYGVASDAIRQRSLDSSRSDWGVEYGDSYPDFQPLGVSLARYTPLANVAGEAFTRATIASYRDANGVRQTAPVNGKRDAHFIAGVRYLLLEGSRTNHFLNSDAPATQTTASLGTGTYTLWMEGTGSIAVAQTTATITGAGTATAGNPVVFVVTVAGTVTYTVTGSPTLAQAELGAFPSSYIPTAGASVTRSADLYTLPFAALPQAMTVYCRFVDLGGVQTLNLSIWTIGNSPQLDLISGTPGQLVHRHIPGGIVSVTNTGLVVNDSIEARTVLRADGSVAVGISRNGATEVTPAPTSALAMAGAWGSQLLHLGSGGTGASPTFVAIQSLKVLPGIRTMADMRVA